ncbi:unnamed protein product [Prunus brigantina]
MLGCKPTNTPIEMNHKLCEDMDQESTNKEQYQRLVGRLIYLAQTRPDISYAVSVVSQFMHSPSVSHRNAVDRILRYLKSAPGKGLIFSKNGDLEVVGYTDVDWAGFITDRRSTSGPNLWKPHHLKIDIQPEAQKLDSEDARIANYFDVIAGTSTGGPAYSLPQNLPPETVMFTS